MTDGNSRTFLTGTMFLTISGVVVKLIGMLNWVFLSRLLGGEGVGLYMMSFPVFLLGLTLSCAGLPPAVSILTAEKIALNDYHGARQVFWAARRLLFFTGACFAVLVAAGAHYMTEWGWVKDSRAYLSILALAPAIFLVTFMASMRGYLQGWQRMGPTAWSEVVEQIFRVAAMLLFAALFLPYGLEFGAAGASMGAGIGAVAALILLFVAVRRLHKEKASLFKNKSKNRDAPSTLNKRLFSLALPIASASIMLPVVANLDMLIVPRRLLVAGYDLRQSTELFGYLTGMGVPLINLATLITAALTIAIIPAVASAKASGELSLIRERTGSAFRLAAAATLPASAGVGILAEPLATHIYGAPGAAPVIAVASAAVFFLGLHQVSTGILQGLGLTKIPVYSMLLAAVLKTFLNWQLVPHMGICGAGWATVADIALAAFINIFFIFKYTGYLPQISYILRSALATLAMAALIAKLPSSLGWVILPLSIAVGVAVYLPLAVMLGGLPKEDIRQLPFIGNLLNKRT